MIRDDEYPTISHVANAPHGSVKMRNAKEKVASKTHSSDKNFTIYQL